MHLAQALLAGRQTEDCRIAEKNQKIRKNDTRANQFHHYRLFRLPVRAVAQSLPLMVVLAVVCDGIVHPAEKQMLRKYRENHGISQQTHLRELEQLGWSEVEWYDVDCPE